jgi:diacylglycerol kinase
VHGRVEGLSPDGEGMASRPSDVLRAAAFTAAIGGPAAADSLPFGRATFLRGFVYAWHGFVYALRTQRNARVHAAIATVAVALGIGLRISPIEFALIFVAIASVFISEMINTVVEACVDLVTTEFHPLARVAKDVAAGAVLLNALLSIVIGLFVFVPHLWPLLLRWVGH